MPKLIWSASGNKKYETGLSQGVLYPMVAAAYPVGVPWDGLTSVTESPGGAEPTDLYADNIKYASLRSAETFGATIEAYSYPEEFGICDGSESIAKGVYAGQQNRQAFGLVYKTQIGSDTLAEGEAYKLHLVYGCTASPSEKSFQSINESPEVASMSWEITTVPVPLPGKKPTSVLVIDSTKADSTKLAALEAVLFGSEQAPGVARLPLPAEIITMMAP